MDEQKREVNVLNESCKYAHIEEKGSVIDERGASREMIQVSDFGKKCDTLILSSKDIQHIMGNCTIKMISLGKAELNLHHIMKTAGYRCKIENMNLYIFGKSSRNAFLIEDSMPSITVRNSVIIVTGSYYACFVITCEKDFKFGRKGLIAGKVHGDKTHTNFHETNCQLHVMSHNVATNPGVEDLPENMASAFKLLSSEAEFLIENCAIYVFGGDSLPKFPNLPCENEEFSAFSDGDSLAPEHKKICNEKPEKMDGDGCKIEENDNSSSESDLDSTDEDDGNWWMHNI